MFDLLFMCFISIHALRGEGDADDVRGQDASIDISIHALRGEGDMSCYQWSTKRGNFNPRPPWGGRRIFG